MVAYVTGTVNQELLLRNKFWGREPDPERSDHGSTAAFRGEKATMAEIAQFGN